MRNRYWVAGLSLPCIDVLCIIKIEIQKITVKLKLKLWNIEEGHNLSRFPLNDHSEALPKFFFFKTLPQWGNSWGKRDRF